VHLCILDPRLLFHHLDNLEVDDSIFQRFESFLIADAPEPTQEQTDEALDLLVENMELS